MDTWDQGINVRIKRYVVTSFTPFCWWGAGWLVRLATCKTHTKDSPLKSCSFEALCGTKKDQGGNTIQHKYFDNWWNLQSCREHPCSCNRGAVNGIFFPDKFIFPLIRKKNLGNKAQNKKSNGEKHTWVKRRTLEYLNGKERGRCMWKVEMGPRGPVRWESFLQ